MVENEKNIDKLFDEGFFKKLDIPPREEFDAFKKNVSKLIKLDLFNYKNTQMERRITFLMNRNNISSLNQYYKILESDKVKLDEFINMLTINVTEFFRNEDKFLELEQKYIPMLIKKFGENLKIWSAGCSCGAEIYSIAMILDKLKILDKCQLIASDFDENILARAKQGIYSRFEIHEEMLEKYNKYFTLVPDSKDEKFQLIPKITSKINFRRDDLLNSKFERNFHLIVCRNVVIYFTEEAKDKLYRNFTDSLCTGGVLFIGTTERINNHKTMGLELASSFFYQK